MNRRFVKMAVAAWAALMLSACMFNPVDPTPGDVRKNATLALSADGTWLLVRWTDGTGLSPVQHARVLQLDGARVVASHGVAVPEGTGDVAFASDPAELLLVVHGGGGASDLLRMTWRDGRSRPLYRAATPLLQPLDPGDGSVLVFEKVRVEGGLGVWQRHRDGETTAVTASHSTWGLALYPIDGNLLYVAPIPPAFVALTGSVPPDLPALIDKRTFSLACADRRPRVCLRKAVSYPPAGGSFSTMEVLSGPRTCTVPGRWKEQAETLSRNGRTVAFHAARDKEDGPRALYVVRTEDPACAAVEVAWRDVLGT